MSANAVYSRQENFSARNVHPFFLLTLSKFLRRTGNFGNSIKNPVIILGCARSGTSAFKEVMSGHRQLATYPFEANELWHPGYYPWRNSARDVPPLWYDPEMFVKHTQQKMTEKQANELRSSFGAYQYLSGKNHLLLKSAMLAFMIPEVLKLIPGMRFIHLYRDGRAVALSYAKMTLRQNKANEEAFRNTPYQMELNALLCHMSELWSKSIRAIADADSQLGLTDSGRMLSVRYEDFCSSPKDTAERVSDWIGIDRKGLREERYSEVRTMNFKFEKEIAQDTLDKMTGMMLPELKQMDYS